MKNINGVVGGIDLSKTDVTIFARLHEDLRRDSLIALYQRVHRRQVPGSTARAALQWMWDYREELGLTPKEISRVQEKLNQE